MLKKYLQWLVWNLSPISFDWCPGNFVTEKTQSNNPSHLCFYRSLKYSNMNNPFWGWGALVCSNNPKNMQLHHPCSIKPAALHSLLPSFAKYFICIVGIFNKVSQQHFRINLDIYYQNSEREAIFHSQLLWLISTLWEMKTEIPLAWLGITSHQDKSWLGFSALQVKYMSYPKEKR